MKKLVLTTISILILITITGIAFAEGETEINISEDEPVYCTMDVQMCSDGSYVGRDPENNCEFYDCPEEDDDETETPILGASCGTVTPGYQNECCERKGFDRWDAEEFECVEENENEEDEQEELIGRSCGTVAPGYQNECCKRKGYYAWNAEEFECENKDEINECEEWNCTRWGECSSEGIMTRECVASGLTCKNDDEDDSDDEETEEQPKLTRKCYEQKQLKPHEGKIECPEECICSGSTIKCSFENGTRVMTVYAGNSGNVIVQIKNINMSTNVTLYKGENGKIYGVFEDNETKEIELPDKVMEKLRERNQKRLQLYNESIELDEEGYYHVEMKKKARLFLLVPVREHVQAEVNAETGETVKIRNPWWGFLARDVRENIEDDSEQETED